MGRKAPPHPAIPPQKMGPKTGMTNVEAVKMIWWRRQV